MVNRDGWKRLTSGQGGAVAGRYILLATAANLAWEMAQLPLYTIWRTGTTHELTFAIAHCTAGDAIILAIALVVAVLIAGGRDWPSGHHIRVTILATAIGVLYTIFSEWFNVEVSRTWAYTEQMPLLPPLGTGLTPFLQWLVIPPLTQAIASSSRRPAG